MSGEPSAADRPASHQKPAWIDDGSLHVSRLDLRDPLVAEEVLALQKVGYRIEADLIGFEGIPPLHETLAELQASREVFLGAWAGAALVGAIAWEAHGDLAEIGRLVVDPAYFRRGIATRLIRCVEEHSPAARAFRVSTGSKNRPAIRFYQEQGFVARHEQPIAPGVFVTSFEKLR